MVAVVGDEARPRQLAWDSRDDPLTRVNLVTRRKKGRTAAPGDERQVRGPVWNGR